MIAPLFATLMRSLDRLYRGGNTGAAMVELAITAPFMVVLALGIADYGYLMSASASLEGATRAIAEYARDSGQCVGGATSTNCSSNISSLVSTLQTNNNTLSSATFTRSDYCTCTDGTVVNCST